MNKIRWHIPGFVDIDDANRPKAVEFSTQDELLSLDRIKQWVAGDDFYQFSIDEHHRVTGGVEHHTYMLMVEKDRGRWWWVLGYLDSREGLDLPDWEPNKKDG